MRQLFEDALERDPATRNAFLAEAAAGDEQMLREVATLLAALARDDSFESPASDVLAHALSEGDAGAPLAGKRIGP